MTVYLEPKGGFNWQVRLDNPETKKFKYIRVLAYDGRDVVEFFKKNAGKFLEGSELELVERLDDRIFK